MPDGFCGDIVTTVVDTYLADVLPMFVTVVIATFLYLVLFCWQMLCQLIVYHHICQQNQM